MAAGGAGHRPGGRAEGRQAGGVGVGLGIRGLGDEVDGHEGGFLSVGAARLLGAAVGPGDQVPFSVCLWRWEEGLAGAAGVVGLVVIGDQETAERVVTQE